MLKGSAGGAREAADAGQVVGSVSRVASAGGTEAASVGVGMLARARLVSGASSASSAERFVAGVLMGAGTDELLSPCKAAADVIAPLCAVVRRLYAMSCSCKPR